MYLGYISFVLYKIPKCYKNLFQIVGYLLIQKSVIHLKYFV